MKIDVNYLKKLLINDNYIKLKLNFSTTHHTIGQNSGLVEVVLVGRELLEGPDYTAEREEAAAVQLVSQFDSSLLHHTLDVSLCSQTTGHTQSWVPQLSQGATVDNYAGNPAEEESLQQGQHVVFQVQHFVRSGLLCLRAAVDCLEAGGGWLQRAGIGQSEQIGIGRLQPARIDFWAVSDTDCLEGAGIDCLEAAGIDLKRRLAADLLVGAGIDYLILTGIDQLEAGNGCLQLVGSCWQAQTHMDLRMELKADLWMEVDNGCSQEADLWTEFVSAHLIQRVPKKLRQIEFAF